MGEDRGLKIRLYTSGIEQYAAEGEILAHDVSFKMVSDGGMLKFVNEKEIKFPKAMMNQTLDRFAVIDREEHLVKVGKLEHSFSVSEGSIPCFAAGALDFTMHD